MASSDAWKALERRVATDLGGTRTGPTGKNTPDVTGLPIPFAPECKYMATLSLRTRHLDQAKRNANGDPWGLFLKERGQHGYYVLVDNEFFVELWNAYVKENT